MFRFTIRELVLATTVTALALIWWVDHWHITRQLEALKTEVAEARANAEHAEQVALQLEFQNRKLLRRIPELDSTGKPARAKSCP